MWKKRVFHHLIHFLSPLFLESIWSHLSTAVMFLFYLSMVFGCFMPLALQVEPDLILLFTITYLFALSIVVNIVAGLLSFHQIAREVPSRSHLILPRSSFFTYSFPFFIDMRNPCRVSQTVAQVGVPSPKNIFEQLSPRVEIIEEQVIALFKRGRISFITSSYPIPISLTPSPPARLTYTSKSCVYPFILSPRTHSLMPHFVGFF